MHIKKSHKKYNLPHSNHIQSSRSITIIMVLLAEHTYEPAIVLIKYCN